MMETVERRELQETERQRDFVLAGNATFTVENQETGGRFTFKVRKKELDDNSGKILHFVRVLTGPDNDNDYAYLGTIFDGTQFRLTRGSRANEETTSYKAFQYIWKRLQGPGLPENVRFYHEGKCCRCGRTLTVPESIEKGIGPECERRTL